MTPLGKIAELKALLSECKEALMNRDPQTRAKECYDSGRVPCQCTLCKINEALKPEHKFQIAEDKKEDFDVYNIGS